MLAQTGDGVESLPLSSGIQRLNEVFWPSGWISTALFHKKSAFVFSFFSLFGYVIIILNFLDYRSLLFYYALKHRALYGGVVFLSIFLTHKGAARKG